MRIEYDSKADVLYIKLGDTMPVESEHLDNNVVIDYDKNDNMVGIEILDFKKRAEQGFSIPITTRS